MSKKSEAFIDKYVVGENYWILKHKEVIVKLLDEYETEQLTTPVISAHTKLKLLREWDAPTHFFPEGLVGSALYFATVCGMTVEKFIEDYESGLFSGWFDLN